VEGEVVLCVRGIVGRLIGGGESRRPTEGKKEMAAAMEEGQGFRGEEPA
jgi:hypothetical protein